ncbi:MAG: hypothetical protein ACRDPC_11795 [Solirubrobacteraceae bacterium]
MAESRRTPDMSRSAAEIDDPILLYARIGYRTFLKYRDGARSPESLYDGYNEAELKRLLGRREVSFGKPGLGGGILWRVEGAVGAAVV